ncbi:MAG: recombinase family protein, partial [Oleispira sp.]
MTKAYSYIRFSTPDQLKGDSLRRQTELSREYAESNDLEYDESLTIHDLGKSAYHSTHAKKGALKLFLDAIEEGRINKGSYLLVESLDRLSRDKVHVALSQFLLIINAGIVIVTLSDKRVYRLGQLELPELMYSIMDMSRAHKESEIKGSRIAASWSNKRKYINVHKLTARAP